MSEKNIYLTHLKVAGGCGVGEVNPVLGAVPVDVLDQLVQVLVPHVRVYHWKKNWAMPIQKPLHNNQLTDFWQNTMEFASFKLIALKTISAHPVKKILKDKNLNII